MADIFMEHYDPVCDCHLFTESSEEMGLLYTSYARIPEIVRDFLTLTEKYIKLFISDPKADLTELTNAIKTFKEAIEIKPIPEPIDPDGISSQKKQITSLANKLDPLLLKLSDLRNMIAFGGNLIRGIIRKPKVYNKDYHDTETYASTNQNLRIVNRALDWVEKVLLELFNLADQDLNLITLVDTVYLKHHIYESGNTAELSDIPDVMYFASPYPMQEIKGKVFMSPHIGIASLFVVNRQNIVRDCMKAYYHQDIGQVKANLEYEEWNLSDIALKSPLREVHITHNIPDVARSFNGSSDGYIYELNISKCKDQIRLFMGNSANREVVYQCDESIPIMRVIPHVTNWELSYDAKNASRHGAGSVELLKTESADMIYDPPLPLDRLPEELRNDEIHRWRAETGIELIHCEPTRVELDRIWANWQLMTAEQKDISDTKSIELFGIDNLAHYRELIANSYKESIVKSGNIAMNLQRYKISSEKSQYEGWDKYTIYSDDGVPTASCIVNPQTKDCADAETVKEYRRQGYMQRLIKYVIMFAGVKYMQVIQTNAAAIALYDKLGFTIEMEYEKDGDKLYSMVFRGNPSEVIIEGVDESLTTSDFTEKSHGSLKYEYRIGIDVSTGKLTAIQFKLEPDAIVSVGNDEAYTVAHLLQSDKRLNAARRIQKTIDDYRVAGNEKAAKELEEKLEENLKATEERDIPGVKSKALDFVKGNIKKLGHIDYISGGSTVDKIFHKDGSSMNSVNILATLSSEVKAFLAYLEDEYDVEDFKVKSPRSYNPAASNGYTYSFTRLFANDHVRRIFAEYCKKHHLRGEEYRVGKIAGENKYRSTKILWDSLWLYMKYTKSPVLRGTTDSHIINDNFKSYNGINKPKRKKIAYTENAPTAENGINEPVTSLDWLETYITEAIDIADQESTTTDTTEESAPTQVDKAETPKNGIKRKKLYMAFIEYAKRCNVKNTFGSVFDKDAFKLNYTFVPEEMRYFYRLANPLLCVLEDNHTFFSLSELKKVNSENPVPDKRLIFAADGNGDVIVFNLSDKAIYHVDEKSISDEPLAGKIADSFDSYLEQLAGIRVL